MNEQLQNISTPSVNVNYAETLDDNEIVDVDGNQIEENYQKRSGTSGLSGQLYETKLLSLILFRVLHDHTIQEFALGSNIEGVGALDDVVLKYKTNNNKTKIIFLQAKHRVDINKDKLTVEDMFKKGGDFNLQKYFESYIKIKQNFLVNYNDVIFRHPVQDEDCEFIVFTSLKEDFSKKKTLGNFDEDKLINTSKHGKKFFFRYDDRDVDNLMSAITKSRVIRLAKSISKFIVRENFNNIMLCELIKIYHVYLAKNVFEIPPINSENEQSHESVSQNKPNCLYCIAKLRKSFMTSSDENLTLMRNVLSKEIAEMISFQNKSVKQQHDVDRYLELMSFKLPINFGNHSFSFRGTDKKKQKRLEYLCSLLEKLLESGQTSNPKYVIIYLNDESVGPDKIVQRKDLENYRLSGLVGNLLIHDDETEMLKFNLEEKTLSTHNIKILNQLRKKYILNKYRLDIAIYDFPKLNLISKQLDKKLVTDFLEKLKFYTNQEVEDQVEDLLKTEIGYFYNIQHADRFCTAKCDAIFLKVHDAVQRWWKQPLTAPYLNKSCIFYKHAEQQVLHSPLLNVIHFVHSQKIKDIALRFDEEAVQSLKLDNFINSEEKTMLIQTEDLCLTNIKIIQHFETKEREEDYLFLELDFVTNEHCFQIVSSQLSISTIPILVLINLCTIDIKALNAAIINTAKQFKGKIIMINNNSFRSTPEALNSVKIFQKDATNYFSSLSGECRRKILEEERITFQGEEVTINAVLDHVSLDILGPSLLLKIINKENIIIGQTINNSSYNNIADQYIYRFISQRLMLKYIHNEFQHMNDKSRNELYFTDGESAIPPTLRQNDIILITDYEMQFEKVCRMFKEKNVHWFKECHKDDYVIWKKTYGNLKTIINYVEIDVDSMCVVNTLKDIYEKTVILSAEPGMGKSMLLSHLTKTTKLFYPNLWILNLNLIDHIDQLNSWKEYNAKIDLLEVMKFLYSINNVHDNVAVNGHILKYLSITNGNEIYLNCEDDLNNFQKELSIVKLFNYFYNNNRLAILLDGFDEICPDYANQVLEMTQTLKDSKVVHLWITSRPYNILHQLELTLNTFSYQLCPLTAPQQALMLQNIWSRHLKVVKDLNTSFYICEYILEFYDVIGKHVSLGNKFMSIPLHLKIIADTYDNLFGNYVNFRLTGPSKDYNTDQVEKVSNLISLYENFIKIKYYEIRLGNKRSMRLNPDMKRIIEREYLKFVENHKKTAAYLIFNKNIILSESDLNEVHMFTEGIKLGEEKTGIIESMVNDEPKFVHLTFAEYFAVEMLFDKLLSKESSFLLWQYLFDDILISDNLGIRRFVNSKLQAKQMCTQDLNDSPKIITFFKKMRNKCMDFPSLALETSMRRNFEHTTRFLLECIKSSVDKSNLDDIIKLFTNKNCVFCLALTLPIRSVTEEILKIVINVDSTKLKNLFYCWHVVNRPPFSPLVNALYYTLSEKSASDIIFRYLTKYNSDLIVDLFILKPKQKGDACNIEPLTLAHMLAMNESKIKYCWNYLTMLNTAQLFKIFSVKDFIGRIPLHFAARKSNFSQFAASETLLGTEKFRIICTTPDYDGFTPICTFPYNCDEEYMKSFKNLLEIVFNEPDIDVDDFVFNRLPKLFPKTSLARSLR